MEPFLAINAVRVVAGGTAVLSGIPYDSALRAPRMVRVTATGNGAYIKFGGDSTVTATANDTFVLAGDSGIFNVAGCKFFSVLQVSGGSNVSVAALEVGGFDTAASLDLKFTASDTLDSRVTFTRASSATRVNSSGLIETVGSNVARFDYDPVTRAAKGLLIEEQRTNYALNSTNFSAWSVGNASIAAAGVATPESSSGGYVLQATGSPQAQVYQTLPASAAGTITFSFVVKAGTASWVSVSSFDGGTRTENYFNVSTGTVGTLSSGATASVINMGNGWYRCSVTKTVAAQPTYAALEVTDADNTNNVTAGKNVYVYAAQLEAGSFPTSLIPTVAATVTRADDSASMTGTNFSSWFNATAGTLYAEATLEGRRTSGFETVVCATAGVSSASGFFVGTEVLVNTGRFAVSNASVLGVDLKTGSAITTNTPFKISCTYQAAKYAKAFNGGSMETSAYASVPLGIDRLTFRSEPDGTNSPFSGWIRRFSYYPSRLSNADLQGLTA